MLLRRRTLFVKSQSAPAPIDCVVCKALNEELDRAIQALNRSSPILKRRGPSYPFQRCDDPHQRVTIRLRALEAHLIARHPN